MNKRKRKEPELPVAIKLCAKEEHVVASALGRSHFTVHPAMVVWKDTDGTLYVEKIHASIQFVDYAGLDRYAICLSRWSDTALLNRFLIIEETDAEEFFSFENRASALRAIGGMVFVPTNDFVSESDPTTRFWSLQPPTPEQEACLSAAE